MYSRRIQLSEHIKKKSIFLLGPRQTGKSTLLRSTFPNARYVDLLQADTFRQLSAFPETLRQSLQPSETTIIIDEIQKLPSLLDEVQSMIDRNKSLRFVLIGSSARKLKRGGANLLGGRAGILTLHPLISAEVGIGQELARINNGGLPAIFPSLSAQQDLNDYIGTYLQEEIQAEGLTRSIGNFSRVLEFASHLNGQQVNYAKVGNDAQVSPRTVKDYFELIVDTLIGRMLPPARSKSSRKLVSTAKFYLFDLGVARVLRREGPIYARSTAFGLALEHLVFQELSAYVDYCQRDTQLEYWRSLTKCEVDFLVNDSIGIEVKASAHVAKSDLKGLRALGEDRSIARRIVVCGEAHYRKTDDGIEIVPLPQFLRSLWLGEIF